VIFVFHINFQENGTVDAVLNELKVEMLRRLRIHNPSGYRNVHLRARRMSVLRVTAKRVSHVSSKGKSSPVEWPGVAQRVPGI
jgi:hypothetical protein